MNSQDGTQRLSNKKKPVLVRNKNMILRSGAKSMQELITF